MKILVFDCETTGLTPIGSLDRKSGSRGTDRIVELAGCLLVDGERVARFETLLNPEREMNAAAAAVNGIKPESLTRAPKFSELAEHVRQLFLGVDVVVGHNVMFDIGFIRGELEKCGLSIPTGFSLLDTRDLAKSKFRFENNKLVTRAAALSVTHQAHRAMGDVMATVGILKKMLDSLYPGVKFDEQVARVVGR
jgi:DNA polymerase III epsilon subunit family exonuclease